MTSSPKIVIYEDSFSDFSSRYGELITIPETRAIIVKTSFDGLESWDDFKAEFDEDVRDSKYDPKRIHAIDDRDILTHEILQADIYFCDGLNDGYYYIMSRVPKDKFVLNSGVSGARNHVVSLGGRALNDERVTIQMLEMLLRGDFR
ncbi:MAG: hypothetical protein AABW73_01220 [Nanoarchaeota archaeon]